VAGNTADDPLSAGNRASSSGCRCYGHDVHRRWPNRGARHARRPRGAPRFLPVSPVGQTGLSGGP
jgi:hypothetical protein